MANELEDLAPIVQTTVYFESNQIDDTGLPNTASRSVTFEAFRALARRANHNSSMLKVFEQSTVSIVKDVPTKTVDVLCSHPIVHSKNYALGDSDQLDRREKESRIRDVLGTDMKTVLSQLFKMSLKDGSRQAARLLHKYLLQRNTNQVSVYAITLIYGLEVDRCIKIDNGLFLMPYASASELYMLPTDYEQVLPIWRSSGSRSQAPQGPRESVAAFVRETTWGLSKEVSPWKDDDETVFSLASIAVRNRLDIRSSFVTYPRWMEHIDINFRGVRSGSYRHGPEGYVGTGKLTGRGLATFLAMYRNWRSFQGDRQRMALIVARLAQAYSRYGRYSFEDSVLDTSIALEIMYKIDNPDSTYKLAIRAAALLDAEPSGRVDTFVLIKKFYSLRSRIAHGNYSPPTSRQQADHFDGLRRDGLDFAAQTLRALLDRGIPENWDHFVVAGIHSR